MEHRAASPPSNERSLDSIAFIAFLGFSVAFDMGWCLQDVIDFWNPSKQNAKAIENLRKAIVAIKTECKSYRKPEESYKSY